MIWLLKNFFKALAAVFHVLPKRLSLFLGDILGLFVYYCVPFRQKLVLEHLSIAFPEKSDLEKKRIAKKSYCHQGRVLVEYSHLPFLNKKWINKNCVLEGFENYAQANQQGKGILILTLHLGNGDLALCALSVLGLPISLISKHFKSEWLNELWFGVRSKSGLKFIPEEKSSYQILKALKAQQAVVFVLDQFMGPPVGVPTNFFGKPTGTAAGLALFAQRSRAPVLPCYTYRDDTGKTHLCFDEPIEWQEPPGGEDPLQFMTQHYTMKLETYIRRHPSQWIWLHRRWKTFEVR